MPDNNNNSKNNDAIRKSLAEQAERLRKMFNDLANKTESDGSNMAFFSLDPNETHFASDAATSFEDSTPIRKPNISPDLAEFFLSAGLLLHDALYMPFRKGRGRLTDFFSWVEKARDRMEAEDFSQDERSAFSEWCQSVGKTLIDAQNKHGLWLTDDEEDLVLAMRNDDLFNDLNGDADGI
jgi:hypothetical protein